MVQRKGRITYGSVFQELFFCGFVGRDVVSPLILQLFFPEPGRPQCSFSSSCIYVSFALLGKEEGGDTTQKLRNGKRGGKKFGGITLRQRAAPRVLAENEGKGEKKLFFARRKLGNWSLSLLRKRRRKEGKKLNRPGSAKGKNKNKRERDGQQSTVRHRATMPPAPPSPLSFFSCAKNPFANYLAPDKKYRTKRRTSIRSCFLRQSRILR